ncbi:pyruvate dehydrogenase protein X component, mitochondrial [Tetranychus urticae]|uniref:Peripheral subunit-binding (PSBD) domain-containing protein n=1 Tax=Tetranychus urticae TaxID=32264 RepID=A0A158P540_TETUR|nr:pyruvate dehydrogenase protein X component, mitochondrial [Tetranychus urticae]
MNFFLPFRSLSSAVSPNLKAGPSVRNLLALYGLDGSIISASGPRNVLLKSDVLTYINQKQLKPRKLDDLLSGVSSGDGTSTPTKVYKSFPRPSAAKWQDIETSGMRRTIAKRLTLSKSSIPHGYMTSQCCVDKLAQLRVSMKKEGHAVSLNDMIIKTSALSLKKVPQVNASWDESNGAVKLLPTVDISIAVATPTGLITPIIKNADNLSVQQISENVKDLAERARASKLKPEEYQGGSFSISNLGMFGITQFVAVINPPQSAILAVGAIKPGVTEDERVVKMMHFTLSFDARVIDEEIAARFLANLKEVIEEPTMGLI